MATKPSGDSRIVDRVRRSMTNPRERDRSPPGTPRLLATPSSPSTRCAGASGYDRISQRERRISRTKKRSGATIALRRFRRADIELQAGASGENERRILSRSRQNGRHGRRGKKKKKMGTHSSLFLSRRVHGERNETLDASIHKYTHTHVASSGYVDVTRVEIPPRRRRMRDARRSKAPPGDSLCLIHVISTPTIAVAYLEILLYEILSLSRESAY